MFAPEEQNPDLAAMLIEERDGILAWMLQGLMAYHAEGLAEPEAVTEATSRYRDEMDSAKRFLETRLNLSLMAGQECQPSRSLSVGAEMKGCGPWLRHSSMRLSRSMAVSKKSGNHRYWLGIRLIDARK